jgi:hypothetical protein
MRIKNYTVDQMRLAELTKKRNYPEGYKSVNKEDQKNIIDHPISQFQEHLMQEGIKQMVFGEGPIIITDGSGLDERDLTEPMKQMLLDFKVIVPKHEFVSIVPKILKMMNIHIVTEDEFYFYDNKVEYKPFIEIGGNGEVGVGGENFYKLKKTSPPEFNSLLLHKNADVVIFIKESLDENGQYQYAIKI